jgi:DNA-binding XRE family transcriptional regulator
MAATISRIAASNAPTRRINWKLFDRLTTARGAKTIDEKAALVGVHRSTLFRLKTTDDPLDPSLALASHLAEVLGTKIDRLFPPTKRAA